MVWDWTGVTGSMADVVEADVVEADIALVEAVYGRTISGSFKDCCDVAGSSCCKL